MGNKGEFNKTIETIMGELLSRNKEYKFCISELKKALLIVKNLIAEDIEKVKNILQTNQDIDDAQTLNLLKQEGIGFEILTNDDGEDELCLKKSVTVINNSLLTNLKSIAADLNEKDFLIYDRFILICNELNIDEYYFSIDDLDEGVLIEYGVWFKSLNTSLIADYSSFLNL